MTVDVVVTDKSGNPVKEQIALDVSLVTTTPRRAPS